YMTPSDALPISISQRRMRPRSSSRSAVNVYGLRVLGDVEPREGLGERHALIVPSARRVVRPDLLRKVVGVEPDLRQHARDMRLRDLRRETIVLRVEALTDVEEAGQR